MKQAVKIALCEIIATKTGSVDPSKFPDETFDLYSIPAFDNGRSELVKGSGIGSSKQVVAPGDVLLSKIVPHIRRAWIVGKSRGQRIIASGEWIVFRSDRADADYLRQVLVGDPFHAQFMNTVAGVGGSLLRARPAHVAKIEIPLPPLPEQRRIAAVLDQAEALRAKRRAALAQLDSLTQAIFLEMFGDPIPNDRHWPVSAIGELDIQIADGNYSSKYPTSSEFVESGVPFIRANNLRDMTVVADDMRFISTDKHHELQKGHLAEGDVLITTRGDIGNIAVVPRAFHDANINAQIVLLRPNPSHLDSRYLAYLLDLPQMKIRIQSFQNGVALKQLPIRQLVRITIPVAPIELQREFARRVMAVEKLKTAHRMSLAELDALFAALQHRAFRGEL